MINFYKKGFGVNNEKCYFRRQNFNETFFLKAQKKAK